MRIEKVGKLASPVPNDGQTPPWWLGRRVQCPNCGTIVSLTLKDAPPQYDSFTLSCPLPGCGGNMNVRPLFDRSGLIC